MFYSLDVTLVCGDGSYIGQVSGMLPDTGHVQPKVLPQPHHWKGQLQCQQQGAGHKLLAEVEEKVAQPDKEISSLQRGT